MSARSWGQVAGANKRLNMAIIGCGGMAGHHLRELVRIREEQKLGILAVCDVYDQRAAGFKSKLAEAGTDARQFHDYHDVLAMDDVDYVLIATPEHQHAQLTLDALDAGKHVYVEKPMTHTPEEAKAVVAKVKQTGLKLQVGVQGMSDDSYITARRAILDGKLGPVVEAQIEYCRWYPADRGPWRSGVDPKMAKPDDLDWSTWLGPAPKRAWDPRRYFNWRCYRDYSGGIATDLFVHRITRILKATGLMFPERVCGMGGIYLWPDGRDLPDNMEALLEYPALEGVTPGMTVHLLGTMANNHGIDHCIRGHKGTLLFSKAGWKIVAEGEKKKGEEPKIIAEHKRKGAESVALQHKNLQAAIRDGAELNCPAELGMYGAVAMCMANASWFTKKSIGWDRDRQVMQPT
jgi:predicted dehydrogenase